MKETQMILQRKTIFLCRYISFTNIRSFFTCVFLSIFFFSYSLTSCFTFDNVGTNSPPRPRYCLKTKLQTMNKLISSGLKQRTLQYGENWRKYSSCPFFLINNDKANEELSKWKTADKIRKNYKSTIRYEKFQKTDSSEITKERDEDEKVLFKFGLLSDIQYGINPEIGASRSGNPRYYKDALIKYKNALMHWTKENCLFGIHLGDFIDGQNSAANTSSTAMNHLVEAQKALYPEKQVYHTIGNHCLYNFNRTELRRHLNLQDCHRNSSFNIDADTDHGVLQASPLYYSRIFEYENLRLKFIFLDGYALSLMATDEEAIMEAQEILKANNKNIENFNSPDGLEGLQRRFVAFGGGLGNTQLKWLEKELEVLTENSKKDDSLINNKCIICVHQGVHPDSCIPMCLLWDYKKLIDVLSKYSDAITAVLSGHAHRGGYYFCEKTKIHYKVLEAVLETKPGQDAHSIVRVFKDKIHVKGEGSVSDGTFYL